MVVRTSGTVAAGEPAAAGGPAAATAPGTFGLPGVGAQAGPGFGSRAGTLSPSRAADFKQCPLLYRFRVVDRLPEPPSSAAVRGTVVHRALELLFDEPAPARTPERARALLAPALAELLEQRPEVRVLFDDERAPEGWLAEAERLVERWFDLEDPTTLEPDGREVQVAHRVSDDLVLRGIVDRVDVAPDGRIRVVDYKTGRAPGEAYEQRALFQMKFYALLLWRTRGRAPSRVQLVYVGGQGQTLPLDVSEQQLAAFERTLLQLWRAIRTAAETGDWRPRRGRACEWCAHRSICPEWGGTPPPVPPDAVDRVLRPPVPDPVGDHVVGPGGNPLDPHPPSGGSIDRAGESPASGRRDGQTL